MSFILGPQLQLSSTSYSQLTTIENVPPCIKLTLDVLNGSIYYQVKRLDGLAGPGGSWNPETLMIPGSKGIVRQGITGVRVRAANATTPVTLVTVELLLVGEA